MKLKHIAAAAALAAVSASSFAAITIDPATGNSELFAVIYDSVDQASYTIDLGVTQDAFNSGANLSQALSSANWTAFLGVANTTANTLQFGVFAADNVGTTAANPNRLWTTVDSASQTVTQGNVGTANTALFNFAGAQTNLSAHQTHSTVANGDSYDTVGNDAYAAGGYSIPTLNGGAVGWAPFVNQGSTAAFKQFTKASSSNSATAAATTFAGVWSFDQSGSNYSLNYTVSAVPDADGLALMLAGLGAMGFIARRRGR